VSALERIYRVSPSLLHDTLTLIKTAWPTEGRATDALPMQGISSFLYCYRMTLPKADEAHLLVRLRITPVEEVYRLDQLHRATRGGTGGAIVTGSPASVAVYSTARRAITTIYNRGLRSRRLADLNQGDLRSIADGRIVDLRDRGKE
jgi:hypothetical protein